MKMDERLANMSVNHKAKLCNRLLRKVYTGTQDLSDVTLSQVCEEWDKNPKARVFIEMLFKGYGFTDRRKITDWLPGYGLFYNPVKMEAGIDSTLKYYTFNRQNPYIQ